MTHGTFQFQLTPIPSNKKKEGHLQIKYTAITKTATTTKKTGPKYQGLYDGEPTKPGVQ